jgi:GTP-binding protein YchF
VAIVRSHSLSIGIVGLPNSGKSTIFNAITESAVPAESYPFCTIDKNLGVVKIPDERLDKLVKLNNSQKVVPSAITFVDIAGLVKGASKGEGLGNKFLSHIREVSAIMYILRAFKSESVSHVYDKISPVDDLKIVRAELILKDLETVEKRLTELKGHAKSGVDSEQKSQIDALEKVQSDLNNEVPAYVTKLSDNQREYLSELWLLTDKPAIYLVNIKGGVDDPELEGWIDELRKIVPREEVDFIMTVDCKTENELMGMDKSEKDEMISMVDDYHGIRNIIELGYKRLDLITFYTININEANARTILNGSNVKEAAGVVHTEFEEKFVAAEVINSDKLLELGGWVKAKEVGEVKNVSKEYIVENGDCIQILATKG